jgi:hypothetical protein
VHFKELEHPILPVHAFALPEFTNIYLGCDSKIFFLDNTTGAAAYLFLVVIIAVFASAGILKHTASI